MSFVSLKTFHSQMLFHREWRGFVKDQGGRDELPLNGCMSKESGEGIGMDEQTLRMNREVREWIQRNSLRWYWYNQRLDEDKLLGNMLQVVRGTSERKDDLSMGKLIGTACMGRLGEVWCDNWKLCIYMVYWEHFYHIHPLWFALQRRVRCQWWWVILCSYPWVQPVILTVTGW